jgi:23S rRNA G2445 N2-methylase RlmL
MSYPPNIERRYTSMQMLADDMEVWAEERQQAEDAKRDLHNRVQVFIKGLRIDQEMACVVLEALQFAAQRDCVLCDAELQELDGLVGFIGGGTP